ncbi:MAG TPA: PKD domain-containing protein [Candidatus Thermoplasmatota archaeon]|nr:PKD domain-containing protein [Candidatus Thermoplasmatota archaeon]
MLCWSFKPRFQGLLLYDHNEDTFNEDRIIYNARPIIYINRTVGLKIRNDTEHYRIDYTLNQKWNESIQSSNVIGQINGTNHNKNILIGCLYDGVYNQASADSSVGIGIMLAIAKYFKENDITPMYNLRFVAFSGEEAGAHGAYSYAKQHEFDSIPIVIDLNQFAFIQTDPPMALWVIVNHQAFNSTVRAIADDTNFPALVNNVTDLITKATNKPGTSLYISDHDPFYNNNHRVFSFVKEGVAFPPGQWRLHHRDGLNHTKGDTMENLDPAEINATADVILNITKYLAIKSQAWFAEDPTITLTDTHDQDNDPDSLTATFPLGADRPHDYLKGRAILISKNYPILKRYMNVTEFTYQDGIIKSLKIDLPRSAPKDYYNLRLYLYNLTGEIDNSYTLFDNQFDNGCYSNDKFIDNNIWMGPPNDPPNTPGQPQGDTEVHTNEIHTYTTSTTDPNNDTIWYQWKWETKILGQPLTYYTMWVTGGPYQSGATCPHIISWSEEGTYHVWVRAKDNLLNPNVMSGWSPYQTVHVTKGDGGSSWNTQFLDSFSLDTVAVNQPTFCGGFNQNVDQGEQSRSIVNWTWNYGDGNVSYGENASHSYSQVGNYTIHLSIRDDHNNYLNCSQNITVLILNAGFRMTGTWQPGKQVRFNDTSAGLYPIVNWTWDFGDGNTSYSRNATHNYSIVGRYNVTFTVRDNHSNTHAFKQPIEVELTPPELAQVVNYPNPTISGTPVTIAVDLLDNQSGIKDVKVNITTPNNVSINATMVSTNLTEYDYTYTYNDTWQPGVYNYSIWVEDNANNVNETTGFNFTIDSEPPSIATINASPITVGFGYNVTIDANVTDDRSGVNNVSINITYPSGATHDPLMIIMSHVSGTLYRYVFSGTWYAGWYNYTIIAYDNAGNKKTSIVHSFNVSVSTFMSIATLKDSFTGNQCINITDPPNPPQNLTVVSRGLTWNTFQNASSGTNILESYQEPVNYREDNGSWTPINVSLSMLTSNHPAYTYGYRIGNNHGLFSVYFKPNIQNDWPVAFTYNRSTDPTIHVVRSKLVGVGYVDPQSNWAYRYLQAVQSSQGQANGCSMAYTGAFTGTNVTWSYGNTELKEAITMSNATKTVLQNHPPSSYGLHDASSYLVFITKLDHQNLNMFNDSGVLSGNVTITEDGVDFKDALGYFKCAMPLGEAYSLNNESVRQKLTYRIVRLHGDTYLLSGLKLSDLNAMVFPVVIDPTLTLYSSTSDGRLCNHSTNYLNSWNALTSNGMIDVTHIAIGQSKQTLTYYIYRGFVFFNTSALPSNAIIDNATLGLYKSSDSSTTDFLITIQNGQPTYPHDPPQTGDYSKTHYSGNGGTLNTSGFGNGYNNISLNNDGISWINRTGWTKLCLRSNRDINGTTPTGNEYVTVYASEQGNGYQPKLVIAYRNQSKIKNTGSTDIKGYLLIQVQFHPPTGGSGTWIMDNDTVNETSSRTITSGSQLGLDTIFNGKIRVSDLKHGTGIYRVYTAFRDPNGNILKTSSGVELKAWWQFSKT